MTPLVDDLSGSGTVYRAYVLRRVVQELFRFADESRPCECIAVLVGWRCQHADQRYVKVVDWATGEAECSRVRAEFTERGVSQYTTFLRERYGDGESRPRIVGIFHSHPFGHEPFFSSLDERTFLGTIYSAQGNVFALCDPLSRYFKVFAIAGPWGERGVAALEEVAWVEYEPTGG